jgi:hypothetical protein
VQKQIMPNTDSFIAFLKARERDRLLILRDIRERIVNTSQLMAAGLTLEEMMKILEKRWPVK